MAQLTVHPKNASFDLVAQKVDPLGDQYLNDGLASTWFRNDHPTQAVTVGFEEISPCTHEHHYQAQPGVGISKLVTLTPGQLVDLGPVEARWSTDSDRQTYMTYSGSVEAVELLWVAVFAGY